jgi:acid phosphatase
MAALACHSAHRPPGAAAEPRPQSAPSSLPKGLLEVCQTARDNGTRRVDPHEDLYSILWQQTAAEYRANTTTVYRAAALALSGLVAANSSGKEPVVVFDLDETVLDNSRFQGRLVAEERNYDSDLWDCWVGQKQALRVPGAELLFRALVDQHVRGRFITNRKCRPRPGDGDPCPQERETLENLNALLKETGYVATPEEILLSAEKDPATGAAWAEEKQPRRDFVSKTHEIVMLVGDDLGDFLAGVRKATIATRAAELEKVDDRWGRSFFLLPNPSYGSWVTAVDQEATATPPRKRPAVVKTFDYPKGEP